MRRSRFLHPAERQRPPMHVPPLAKSVGPRLRGEIAKSRYKWLTLALASTVVLAPLAKDFTLGMRVIDAFVLVAILVTLPVTVRTKRKFLVLLAAAITTGVLLLIHRFEPQKWIAVTFHLPLLYLLAAVAGLILVDILSTSKVTVDTIAGAICVYMLIGFVFAVMYSLCATVIPDAFVRVGFDAVAMEFHGSGFGNTIYFSFVTLTTVGYGDITPRAEVVRSLAIVEAMVGQVYLTVLVARLVGMHLSIAGDRREHVQSPDTTHQRPGP